jgi:hypothetical protein
MVLRDMLFLVRWPTGEGLLTQEGAMPRVYIVKLSEEERKQLLELTRKGKVSARKLNRAHTSKSLRPARSQRRRH